MERRGFLRGLASISVSGLGTNTEAWAQLANGSQASFMEPEQAGRCFTDIRAARAARLNPGDQLLVRELDTVVAGATWSRQRARGKWDLRAYRLDDAQTGNLLLVNDVAGNDGPSAVPPELEVKLDLPGWYAIWIGVPMLDLKPTVASYYGGVDAALDNDSEFAQVAPDRGTRHSRVMGTMEVEIDCYWKCSRLDGRTLRLRVPYGTWISFPWGIVRGSISSLRFVRLSDQQVEAYKRDVSDLSTKRVIVVNDGFSPVFNGGEPGKGIDTRFPEAYRNSDIKMFLLQTPSTGVASWPSQATSLLGEGMTATEWKQRRQGDRRAYDYIQWAIKNRQEGFRAALPICRKGAEEFHASLRMNLFFRDGTMGGGLESYFNGRFWKENPELRKRSTRSTNGQLSEDVQLDYAQPRVRRYIMNILMELATRYDVDGIDMDFTRWPPIADPARHDCNVLTSFIKEVRTELDHISRNKGRKLALSAMVVDGYHAKMTLSEQKIDLHAWLASNALDFICVQAWDHRQFLSWAKQYKTPYYLIHDQDPWVQGGWRHDPDWTDNHDPLPGEDSQTQPPVNNTLDPTEYDAGLGERYKLGIDGVCLVNSGGNSVGNFCRRLGHFGEIEERIRRHEIWGQRIGPRIQLS